LPSGVRAGGSRTSEWKWKLRRQTTAAPGELVDKGTKGKRTRTVPIIEEIRELVSRRIAKTDGSPDARYHAWTAERPVTWISPW
jgi:hypothetical protein